MRKTPCPVAVTLFPSREGTTTNSPAELAEWIKMGAQGAPLRWEKMADGLVGINPNLVTVVKLAGTNVPALWSWAEEWPDRPGRLVFATSQTDISLRRGVIVTHPGVFHADEVYAVAWLIRYVMPEANEIVIVRTRDEKFLAAAKTNRDVYVLDVGGVYEPLNHNYDHHQTGAPCRKSGLPYAALGLVVGSTGVGCGFYYPEATELDEALIQAIDATDTGASEGYQTLRGHPEVRIPARGVSAVIHGFNPTSGVEADFNRAFEQALKFAGQDLDNAVDAAKEAVESRQRVHDAIEATQEPWVVLGRYETVAAEVAATARPDLKYIVFPDETSGTWRILQVPVKPGSHEGRWPLPLHWRGMRGKDLDEASGIAGCVFCHASGFIAGHATKEGAIEMARKAVVS